MLVFPLDERVAVLLRARVGLQVLGPGAVGRLGPQVEVELRLALGVLGAEQVRQVVVGRVLAAGGRAVEGLGLVGLGVEGGAEAGRGWHVPVEETIIAGVQVLVAGQAGTVLAV